VRTPGVVLAPPHLQDDLVSKSRALAVVKVKDNDRPKASSEEARGEADM